MKYSITDTVEGPCADLSNHIITLSSLIQRSIHYLKLGLNFFFIVLPPRARNNN